MALRNILTSEEPRLRKKSREISEYNNRLHILLDDMRETLIKAEGVGLAAPQVGVLRRAVIVIDTNKEELPLEEQIIELINPEIIAVEGEQNGQEGCLSVPGVWGLVSRPEKVTVKANDRYGNDFLVEGTGLTARCFCHEIDHLNGILFTDVASEILHPDEDEEFEDGVD